MSRRRLAMVLGALVLVAGAARAATFTSTSVRDLAAVADVIVRVHVESSHARWLEETRASRVVTFHEVRVLEILRGTLQEGEQQSGRVLVGVPGGIVGDVEQRVPGAPALEAGREYVLLLGRGDGPGGARGIAGLRYGALPAGPHLTLPEQARLDDALPVLRATPPGATTP